MTTNAAVDGRHFTRSVSNHQRSIRAVQQARDRHYDETLTYGVLRRQSTYTGGTERLRNARTIPTDPNASSTKRPNPE